MIDIHSHFLYNIDDGASDLFESIHLCKMSCDCGMNGIVATPHIFDFEQIDKRIEERDRRISEVQAELALREIDLEIYKGFEVFINDEIFFADGLEKLTINNSRYLLCEFNFKDLRPQRFFKYIEEILDSNLIPIICHPERMSLFLEDEYIVPEIVDLGGLLQLNALSISNAADKQIKDLATSLLEKRAYDFIASDAHNVAARHSNLIGLLSTSSVNIPYEYFEIMTTKNPLAVVNNETINCL
jgi:protein-tyrosine phosphatase